MKTSNSKKQNCEAKKKCSWCQLVRFLQLFGSWDNIFSHAHEFADQICIKFLSLWFVNAFVSRNDECVLVECSVYWEEEPQARNDAGQPRLCGVLDSFWIPRLFFFFFFLQLKCRCCNIPYAFMFATDQVKMRPIVKWLQKQPFL